MLWFTVHGWSPSLISNITEGTNSEFVLSKKSFSYCIVTFRCISLFYGMFFEEVQSAFFDFNSKQLSLQFHELVVVKPKPDFGGNSGGGGKIWGGAAV